MAEFQNLTISDTGFLQLPIGTSAEKSSVTTTVVQFTTVGSNSWTCPQGVTAVDVLVVAGAGGGGQRYAGGGGAGGLIYRLNYPVTPGNSYTVTVGAGGAGGTEANGRRGINGGNSVFDSLTAIGGGGGGELTISSARGFDGGSGGGVSIASTTPGAGTAGQGFPGGISGLTDNGTNGNAAAGGGGAGGPGSNVMGQAARDWGAGGGPGVNVSISGTATWYAGGGGGGTGNYASNGMRGGLGGIGGGGAGGSSYLTGSDLNGSPGAPNTGGGGGGGGGNNATAGGNGGSGVVIIRYSLASELGKMRYNSDTKGIESYQGPSDGWVSTDNRNFSTSGNGIIWHNGYRVHVFNTVGNSTFVPQVSGKVDVLCVAAGGGGTGPYGGGGGGGGVLLTTDYPVTGGKSYTVTVGAGGAGGTGSRGSNGGNSIFGTLVAIGGGAGGLHTGPNNTTVIHGANGGGGGGGSIGSFGTPPSGYGGGGTFGQGFAGGRGDHIAPQYPTGGGGGASEPGEDAAPSTPLSGAGGRGRMINFSGTDFWGGGGGGGGQSSTGPFGFAKLGGGGAGGNGGSFNGRPGAPNTGGGGGGGASSGGAGGSGIVLVRYRAPIVTTILTPGTGTWTVPTGVTQIYVRMWGGGGSSGQVLSIHSGSAGGGAGAAWYATVTPGTNFAYTVGEGGAQNNSNVFANSGSNTSGLSGGSSTFMGVTCGGGLGARNNGASPTGPDPASGGTVSGTPSVTYSNFITEAGQSASYSASGGTRQGSAGGTNWSGNIVWFGGGEGRLQGSGTRGFQGDTGVGGSGLYPGGGASGTFGGGWASYPGGDGAIMISYMLP
jgi:hypothetical protein